MFCGDEDSVSIPQSGFGAFEPFELLGINVSEVVVSIPQSGFGAFELRAPPALRARRRAVSIPQSGFGAFEPSFSCCWILSSAVSIPQSGFGAFEHAELVKYPVDAPPFQSLSRDSGRLNPIHDLVRRRGGGGFNPSVGIRGV